MPNTGLRAIVNDDGKVGYVQSASKYLTSDDLDKKYKLLAALSIKKQPNAKVVASGVDGKATNNEGQVISEIADKDSPNILNFLSKMEKFEFSPPSDNLWVVKFYTYDKDGKQTSLTTLYDSIIAANTAWNSVVSPRWKVTLKDTNINIKDYINDFQTKSGMFLAQSVNFTPQASTITESVFSQAQQHQAFFNFGFLVQGRQINRSLKINFLVSNWDIGDILFEPWIAAVAQRGMIEDGISSSIKARIILQEYSSGIPSSFNGKEKINRMQCRKQYIFENCIPINRGSVERDYDFNNAGTFKSSIIEFKFQDYQINYLI